MRMEKKAEQSLQWSYVLTDIISFPAQWYFTLILLLRAKQAATLFLTTHAPTDSKNLVLANIIGSQTKMLWAG